jgi:hypothetical protein
MLLRYESSSNHWNQRPKVYLTKSSPAVMVQNRCYDGAPARSMADLKRMQFSPGWGWLLDLDVVSLADVGRWGGPPPWRVASARSGGLHPHQQGWQRRRWSHGGEDGGGEYAPLFPMRAAPHRAGRRLAECGWGEGTADARVERQRDGQRRRPPRRVSRKKPWGR